MAVKIEREIAVSREVPGCQETELAPPAKKSKADQSLKSLSTSSPSSSTAAAASQFTDSLLDTSHSVSTASTTTPASSAAVSSLSHGRTIASQPAQQPQPSPATKVSPMMSISQPTKVRRS